MLIHILHHQQYANNLQFQNRLLQIFYPWTKKSIHCGRKWGEGGKEPREKQSWHQNTWQQIFLSKIFAATKHVFLSIATRGDEYCSHYYSRWLLISKTWPYSTLPTFWLLVGAVRGSTFLSHLLSHFSGEKLTASLTCFSFISCLNGSWFKELLWLKKCCPSM